MRLLFLLSLLLVTAIVPAEAQFFNFGKNRVQYESHDWRVIQSEHFDVMYYSANNYKLGEFSVDLLESAYKQISEDFLHQIADRIVVIIYDSDVEFAQTNVIPLPEDAQGILGVTDLYKNRVTIWFTGDYEQYKHTLHHELVHAVVNDMFYGGSIQSIIQNDIQLAIPLWFNEGIAEYSSVGFDTNTDNFVRDAVVNNYLPDIPGLGGYFAYRGGQSVWDYIVETYGRPKIGEIFQNVKSSRSVEGGFRQSLGLSTRELSDRWKEYLKKRYYPEVANRETLAEISTQLTFLDKTGGYNTSPAISPQGDKIAMISNKRGYFDLVAISAIDGKFLKTLIKGDNNVDFESLNILNPNISWSPDGRKIVLATRRGGSDQLSIVDYKTGDAEQIRFDGVDAILTASWSPDGRKIAFSGTIGAYSDIFVYTIETGEVKNVTNDLFSDLEPAWGANSQALYFTSDRGPNTELGVFRDKYTMLLNPDLHNKDLYKLVEGESKVTRLTSTPDWNETRPLVTGTGKLVFISDQNGIPNVYEMDMANRASYPLTDLISGVQQMSISPDGSKLIMNNFYKGQLHVFLLRAPFSKRKTEPLTQNQWAQRREAESEYERVPAVRYSYEMYAPTNLTTKVLGPLAFTSQAEEEEIVEEEQDPDIIDFRNYQFGEDLDEEAERVAQTDIFEPIDNKTEDGRYQPKSYRLKFSPDIRYFQGIASTQFGAFGFTELYFSDVLGNHRISFASNLVFDLRNSNYVISYGNYTNRTNYTFTWFHQASQFQSFNIVGNTFQTQLVRFRTYGGGATADYPFSKFSRLTYGVNVVGVSRDLSELSSSTQSNESAAFLQPSVTFTTDRTRPGFLTPSGGFRYAVSLTGSPPVTNETARFFSVLGDYRAYLGAVGSPYSLAIRLSGGASVFRDQQTFFLGGMQNWINQRWEGGDIPLDRLEDLFFTLPALPMRGYSFNALFGSNFGLANAEFRFPLVAAILPGPIPIIPLYNLQGVFFADLGFAWGLDINYVNQRNQIIATNPAGLDLQFSRVRTVWTDANGNVVPEGTAIPLGATGQQVREGDLLLGMGYGLRTILLGLPFRFDVGWPYDGDSFGRPVYYFSIGLDF